MTIAASPDVALQISPAEFLSYMQDEALPVALLPSDTLPSFEHGLANERYALIGGVTLSHATGNAIDNGNYRLRSKADLTIITTHKGRGPAKFFALEQADLALIEDAASLAKLSRRATMTAHNIMLHPGIIAIMPAGTVYRIGTDPRTMRRTSIADMKQRTSDT